jgi:hypothetical protein
MQQNNNRMSTLITTHPIFTRTEKEQQQSVDSSISFSSRFFFQNKNPTDEKLVQSINTSHRDRSPPFWASSSPQTPNPICLDPSASDFSFGCCSISIREYLFYLAYQFDDRFAGTETVSENSRRLFFISV